MTEPLVRPDLQTQTGTIEFPSEVGISGLRTAEQPADPFVPSGTQGDEHGLTGQTKSQTRMIVSRFFHQPLAVIGLCVFAGLGIACVVVGHVWRYSYSEITPQFAVGPSLQHPFGVDDIGHDMFAQVFRGMEKDIQTALLVAVLSGVIGVTIGALAGFFRGWVDSILMRFVDLILCVPLLAVLIVLSNIWASQAGSWVLIAVIVGILSWTYMARLVRADFLSLREREFVEASRALGASNFRIIVRHLMPNAVATIIVNSTLTVALAIVLESTLSFLGLGIQPPDVSLGLLVSNAQDSATTQWWLFAFPALFLVVLILSVFLIGDGLREAFDPKKTRVRA
jgi:ABC-type dipeptide/oligopeptide/nickel transport system permease subunit